MGCRCARSCHTVFSKSHLIFDCVPSVSHGVVNFFARLWGTGISDAIFVRDSLSFAFSQDSKYHRNCPGYIYISYTLSNLMEIMCNLNPHCYL